MQFRHGSIPLFRSSWILLLFIGSSVHAQLPNDRAAGDTYFSRTEAFVRKCAPAASTIGEIVVHGNKLLDAAAIIRMTERKVGDPCSAEVLDAMRDKLTKSGYFGMHHPDVKSAWADVKSEEIGGGKCKVTITVDENDKVTKVVITGSGPVRPQEVEALITSGSVYNVNTVETDAKKIIALYNDLGYEILFGDELGMYAKNPGVLVVPLIVARLDSVVILRDGAKVSDPQLLSRLAGKAGDYLNRKTAYVVDRNALKSGNDYADVEVTEKLVRPGRVQIQYNLVTKKPDAKEAPLAGVVFPLVTTAVERGYGPPLVEVTLNHKVHGTFSIDTGAASSIVSDAIARQLGLTPTVLKDKDGAPQELAGKPITFVHADSLAISDMRTKGAFVEVPIDLVVLSAKTIRGGAAGKVDGILGMNLLGRCTLFIDPPWKTAGLMWPRALNHKELVGMQMDDAITVPLADRGDGVMTARVRLNNSEDLSMVVDTGAQGTIISMATVDKLNLKPVGPELRANTFSGPGGVSEVMMERISLGTAVQTWSRIYCTKGLKGLKGLEQTLGMDLLSRYRLMLDGPNKTLYLKSYAAETAAPPKK
jgi:predicted aspartyl protease